MLACGCVCCLIACLVSELVLSCSLFVLKVRGIAEIECNLKDTALEQALLQMDLLRSAGHTQAHIPTAR